MKIAKYMGLDLGSVTCGVSVSDGLKMFAHPYETIRMNEEDLKSLQIPLKDIIEKENIERIILGYPLMMNGDVGPRALISEKFKELLDKWFDIEVILMDERLSSKQATRQLIDMDVSRKKRKKVIDQMAAVSILQTYLDQIKF